MKLPYDKNELYRAHLARDPRFDGKFFVGVKTTKIYCRPICPARKAQLKNLTFFRHAAEAEKAGYRPCLRCRPETAPGSPAWVGTSATIRRAVRMMNHYALESLSIKEIAAKLGVGERWLRELFQQQLGVSPQAYLISEKLDIARNLLDNTSLSMTEIAFSSGFQSVRRFNDLFKARFHKSPSAFRQEPTAKKPFRLQLSYRPPYDWDRLLKFFQYRAISGMELVKDNSYQRLMSINGAQGWFKATHCKDHKISIELKLNHNTNIIELVDRLTNLFDLDADPMAIEQCLGEDERLQPFLQQYRGLRIPGAWDGFELAVRAIIGQKISVKAARTVLGRLVTLCGDVQTLDSSLPLKHYFPTPENILAADLSVLGLTTAKINTIKALAEQVAHQNLVLDGTADEHDIRQKLLAIKGIGAWTVEYIAMRALNNPDGFPESDLEIQKKIRQYDLHPQQWTPWRAYGAMLLWNM